MSTGVTINSTRGGIVFKGVGVDEVGTALSESVEFFVVGGVFILNDVLFELIVGVLDVLPDD